MAQSRGESNQKALPWEARPLFEPMWGGSQLSDPSRRAGVVKCFEQAFEEEAHRLMGLGQPNAIEKLWASGRLGWGAGCACLVAGLCAAGWGWSRSGNAQMSWMDGAAAASWCGAAVSVGLYWIPSMMGMDPIRPWWAKRGGALDAGFISWVRASVGQLSTGDAEKLDFIARVDSARALHDVWMALRGARELLESKR